jgi:hypothetical protein
MIRDYSIFTVKGNLYRKCEEAATIRWTNEKKNKKDSTGWSAGANPNDILIGILGEVVVGYWFGVDPNLEYVEKGDKFDLEYQGQTIEVKTSVPDFGCGLLRAKKHNGYVFPLNSDIYVFCLIKLNTWMKECDLEIKGYTTKKLILSKFNKLYDPRSRKFSGFWNYEIPYNKLFDLRTLN